MSEFDDETISSLIDRIIEDKYIFSLSNKYYYQISPNISIKNKANILYQQTYNDYIYDDSFVTEQALELMLVQNKILPFSYQKNLKDLETRIEDTKVRLYKQFANKKSKESIKKDLDKYKNTYIELSNKKHIWDFLLLKNYAFKAKTEYLLTQTIYDYETDFLIFDSKNIDIKVMNNVIDKLHNDPLRNIDTFKHIALSGLWRNYWSSNAQIFKGSISEWSDDQRTLVVISKMYHSIYEHPDCPDDAVFEDFDAIDGWMIMQKRKNIAEKKQKGVNEILGKDGKNSSEVFLMAQTQQDAEDILSMNSDEGFFEYKRKLVALNNASGSISDFRLNKGNL